MGGGLGKDLAAQSLLTSVPAERDKNEDGGILRPPNPRGPENVHLTQIAKMGSRKRKECRNCF